MPSTRSRLAGVTAPAPVMVLGAIASVQIGAAVATKMFPAVGPGGTVFLRLLFSAVLLLLIARPAVRSTSRRDLVAAVAFGVVLAAMNGAFYLAIDRIPLGVAVTVEFLGPLGVAVAGSRKLLDLLWVTLAAGGVVLLAHGGGHVDLVGIVLAAVAGGFWAAYILLSQRVGRAFPGMTGLALALAVGAMVIAPYGVAVGGGVLLHPAVLWRGALVALLSSVVAYTLELAALRRLRAAVFGVLMSLEPAMAALSGLVFLSQSLHLSEWVAVGFVMVASIGATTDTASDDTELPAAADMSDVEVRV